MIRHSSFAIRVSPLIALLLAAPALADPARQPQPFAFFIHHENDGTFVKPNDDNDRHYTSGAKLVIAHQPEPAREWAAGLEELAPFLGTGFDRAAFGYVAGQNLYSPQQIERHELIDDDRPFAGWLYGGAFWERSNDTTLDHVEINLGIVGPSALGERTQVWIHRNFEGDTPHGWPHQIADEPALHLYLQRKWKLPLAGEEKAWALQAIPQAGGSLGTVYRNLNAGVTLRFGWNLPDDFGPGRIEDVTSVTGELRPYRRDFSFYVFGRLGGKAVEHDLFIEGSEFREGHGVDARPLVGEGQLGVAFRWMFFEASYSQTYRTKEFYGQDESDAFGAIMLSAVWEF